MEYSVTIEQKQYREKILALRAPLTTAAEYKFCDVFPRF